MKLTITIELNNKLIAKYKSNPTSQVKRDLIESALSQLDNGKLEAMVMKYVTEIKRISREPQDT